MRIQPGTLLPARGISAGNNPHPTLRLDYSASLGVPLPCALPQLAEGQPQSSLFTAATLAQGPGGLSGLRC